MKNEEKEILLRPHSNPVLFESTCNLYDLIQFDFENRKREIHSRNKDQSKWYSAAPPGFTYCLKEAFCAATP